MGGLTVRAGLSVACVCLLAAVAAAPAMAATSPTRPVTSPMPRDPARDSPWAWEPGFAIDASGTTWAVGNHCALVDQHGTCQADTRHPGQPDYTPLWNSSDGGRSYHFVSDPLRQLEQMGVVAGGDRPGGEDTDVAVARASRPGRPPLLYVVSAFDASSTLAISGDGGHSWRLTSLAGFPAQDRPWLATSGACDVYLEYHLATGAENVAAAPRVDRFDGCALFDRAVAGEVTAVPASSTAVEGLGSEFTRSNQVMGHVVAAGAHVYVPYVTCDTPGASLSCNETGARQSIHVAVSADRGAIFQSVTLPAAGLHGDINDGTWPLSAAADSAGHLAVVATDLQRIRMWTSADRGRTWTLRPHAVDEALGADGATVPTVALDGRTSVVAWYGAPPAPGPRKWKLIVARSDDATRTFTVQALDPTLATTAPGQPLGDALYDDFGVVITPQRAIALAYTQSCAGRVPSDAECPGPSTEGTANALIVRSAWVPAPAPAHRRVQRRRPRRVVHHRRARVHHVHHRRAPHRRAHRCRDPDHDGDCDRPGDR